MTMYWFDRAEALRRLADDPFDVLVVGGGVTGAGTALDAASRGLRTALVERDDFASGTSSKSSKLAHGGLRYLQQRELRLVYEALHERQRLTRNAPHLVKLLPFLIPIFGQDGVLNPKLARALGTAMWLYDLTGGARIGKLHERLTKAEALELMPTLPEHRLVSAYKYYDATVDDARLTLTLARTAAIDFGAAVANQCRLVGVHKDRSGRVEAASVEADGQEIRVRCSAIVNATGVWADDVRALDEARHPDSIRPAKGIHITVPWNLVQNDIAVVVPVPKDKRSVFVVPWDGFTYIGTTDTDYDGPLEDPQCTTEDIDYLLSAINFSTTTEITRADITGTWAGLRPLVKNSSSGRTADLSRRHRVSPSGSGVITITGGKLTTYREMAADTVDQVLSELGEGVEGRTTRRSRTKNLPLRGAEGYQSVLDTAASADRKGPLDAVAIEHLANRYGGDSRTILAMVDLDPTLGAPLVEGLPYLRAEAVYAARYEMALTVDDVLSRRTRARLLRRDASVAAAADVAALIGPELALSEADQAAQVDAYRKAVEVEVASAGLPGSALPDVALDGVTSA